MNNKDDWKDQRSNGEQEGSSSEPDYDSARGRQEQPFASGNPEGAPSRHEERMNDAHRFDTGRTDETNAGRYVRRTSSNSTGRSSSTPSDSGGQGGSPGGRRVLAWVAMALACILIGGSAGGLLVYGLMESRVQVAESRVSDGANDPEEEEQVTPTAPTAATDEPQTADPGEESESTDTATTRQTNVQTPRPGSNGFDMATATNQDPVEDPLTTIEIAAVASPSVVAVYTEMVGQDIFGRPVTGVGAGSGVLISTDGYIVTNNHVIDGANEIHVDLPNGQKQVSAVLVGTEPSADLAVLRLDPDAIPGDGLPAIRVADSDALQVGELTMAIGNPLGDLQGSVSLGIVSALDRQVTVGGEGGMLTLEGNIQTDAAINSGNSGGALVNAFGELIGINVAKASGGATGASVEGIGFAIPVNKVIPIVNDLINYGYVTGKPRIGVTGRAITIQYREGYNMPAGVMVQGVAEDSGADEAGIQIGDIIISVDGETITTVSEINRMVEQKEPGDTVELGIIRGQNEITVEVTLSEWIPADDANR